MASRDKRKREKLTTGVYSDKFGVAIVVSVQGKPREFRWELNAHGEKLRRYVKADGAAWLLEERKRVQKRERLKIERQASIKDVFSKDVERYLETISSKGHRVNSQGYLAHWTAHFKNHQRNKITDLDVQTAFASIDQANSTKRHIRRALINFYEAMNGKSGYNPGRSLRQPPKDEEPVRDIPWPWIERLFKALPESRTKARLMLIAYVGLPHKQIALLKPSDLRLNKRQLIVHPRRKGAGAAGRAIPLSPVAIAALKEFKRLDAFGSFQNRQLVETFRSGAKKAKLQLPEDVRPYDLRHSFLTEVARGGADIQDIATLGMHATLQQASRYIKGAASARATKMIAAVPRFTDVAAFQTDPKHSTSTQREARKGTADSAGKE